MHKDTHRGIEQITCIVADVLERQRPSEQREIGRVSKLRQSYTQLYLPCPQLDIYHHARVLEHERKYCQKVIVAGIQSATLKS